MAPTMLMEELCKRIKDWFLPHSAQFTRKQRQATMLKSTRYRHEGCTITFFSCSAGILLTNSGGIYLSLSAWFNISFMSPTRISAFWSIMLCRISFRGDWAPSDILRQILKPSNCGIVAWVRLFPRDRSTVIQKNKYWLNWKKAKLSVNINLQPSRVPPMQRKSKTVFDSGFHALDSRYIFLIFCQWSLDSRFQSLTGLTATRKGGFAKLGESNVGLGK